MIETDHVFNKEQIQDNFHMKKIPYFPLKSRKKNNCKKGGPKNKPVFILCDCEVTCVTWSISCHKLMRPRYILHMKNVTGDTLYDYCM